MFFILSRDGVITLRRNRDIYDMSPTLRLVFMKTWKFCRYEVRKDVQYILACSTGARLIVHLSVAAKARG